MGKDIRFQGGPEGFDILVNGRRAATVYEDGGWHWRVENAAGEWLTTRATRKAATMAALEQVLFPEEE